MRSRAFICAVMTALIAIAASSRTTGALGRPGVTPVPCPQQPWQIGDSTFEALQGAKSLQHAVAAAGKQDLLRQRVYRIAGHCGFSQLEMVKSFDDLTAWVHNGTRPEGDDVSGDLRNAGLTFTNPLRPNDPGTLRMSPAAKDH